MSETHTPDDQHPTTEPGFDESGVMMVDTSDVKWPVGASPRKPRKEWPEATRDQSAIAPGFDDGPMLTGDRGAHDDMLQLIKGQERGKEEQK